MNLSIGSIILVFHPLLCLISLAKTTTISGRKLCVKIEKCEKTNIISQKMECGLKSHIEIIFRNMFVLLWR